MHMRIQLIAVLALCLGMSSLSAALGQTRSYTATVVCIHKPPVAALTDGLIDQLLVDQGATVKKGETLLTIDSRVADAELAVAVKELEAAEKQAKQTANVDYADAAAILSREEYNDEMTLWDRGATTFSALQRKRLEAQRAKYGYDVAVVEHEKEILAEGIAREKLKAAQVRLGMYKVTSPYDGVIAERMRDQGEWIRAGEPVLRLMHMNEMKVEARIQVDGISIAELLGASVKIRFQLGQNQFEKEATIDFVSPLVDSGLVLISTRIANEQTANGDWLLRDGTMATIELVGR